MRGVASPRRYHGRTGDGRAQAQGLRRGRGEERLKAELPHWYLEDGWIRRRYRTSSWKGTLMVINAVGHLAEAAWHHPDLTASYAWVEVRLMTHDHKGVTDKDFQLARKIEEVVQGGSPASRAGRWKGRRRTISASPTSSTTRPRAEDALHHRGSGSRAAAALAARIRLTSSARLPSGSAPLAPCARMAASS